jgi:hypothetical protein
MCWFITVGVPPQRAAELEQLGKVRAGLAVRPSTNPSLAAIFPAGDVRFELTHGGCSCDLTSRGHAPADPESEEKLRRRYQAQGWSQAKIERAVAAAIGARTAASHRRQDSGPKVLFRDAVVDQVRRAGGIRLFAHFYRGSPEVEELVCTERRRLTEDDFLTGDLPADVLVDLTATR